jgi:hypothetical protein
MSGHQTMEFFEMCAALITQLARWSAGSELKPEVSSTPEVTNLQLEHVVKYIGIEGKTLARHTG